LLELRRLAFIFSQRTWLRVDSVLLRSLAYRGYSTIIGALGRLSDFALAWTVVFIVLTYRATHRVEPNLVVRFALLLVAGYLGVVNVLGAYGDFARLMAPAVVPLNALSLLLLVD